PLKSAIDKPGNPRQYIHALWALQRLNALDNERIVKSLAFNDPLIQLHALRVWAERDPDPANYELIAGALKNADPHVRRAAVELLAKYPNTSSLEAALQVLRETDPSVDNHLYYTSRLCIRNILR